MPRTDMVWSRSRGSIWLVVAVRCDEGRAGVGVDGDVERQACCSERGDFGYFYRPLNGHGGRRQDTPRRCVSAAKLVDFRNLEVVVSMPAPLVLKHRDLVFQVEASWSRFEFEAS